MAPSTTGRDITKRSPSSTLCQLAGSLLTACGAVLVMHISTTDTTSSADAARNTVVAP
jgi:hypothetical protein